MLQHVLIEGGGGHALLELAILLFQLLEAAQFGDSHPSKLLLPPIQSLPTDDELATYIATGIPN
jgi:hypothetical protein